MMLLLLQLSCFAPVLMDTGISAAPGDTAGDTGETGDTSDTGDTSETGDP